MKFFAGKMALVTGGSSGIGLAIAKQIIQNQGSVAILARRPEMLSSAINEVEKSRCAVDQKILALQGDVTIFDSLEKTLDDFSNQHGIPDIIFNSAGVAHPGNFSNLSMDIFHWMMDVNYFGTVNVLKILVPGMQKRRSGTVVNISSVAGFIGVYGYTAYGASKYAVAGFSDALRSELNPYNIKVSVVFPPDTDTPQLEYEKQYKPFITKEIAGSAKLMSANVVAREIVQKVAGGKYIILPGGEGKLLYFAHHFLGWTLYPIMDLMVRSSIQKLKFKK
ncbi:MAG: SDR family oxidoreductase [Anaerolineaceae bacterium]|nr:SDR family oxidoreductase [Anaerolineaceae bacterium]